MAAGTIQPGGGGNTGRRRRRGASGARPMSEINVTPFVDVMLVLLIIFMVAAPLLTAGVPIELPETAAAPLPQEQEEPLALTVAADGRVLIGSQEVPRDELLPRLRAIAGERQGDKVFLRADGTVPYSDVMVVMGALNAGGFRNIGLVTDAGGPTLDGTAEE
ncbi:ExbD/TolR family protein [uncultured Jannaschia sp.]|uniref:ExbD/TolR family protein n=1 Tax=uncultured Jannaschia sp. TaxID=293347 RepID=UPI00261F5496|nr:ExbD/TolR family protein [uncultured Jannaschia sp.]